MATRTFTVEAVDGRTWIVSASSKEEALNDVAAERGVPRKDLSIKQNRRPS